LKKKIERNSKDQQRKRDLRVRETQLVVPEVIIRRGVSCNRDSGHRSRKPEGRKEDQLPKREGKMSMFLCVERMIISCSLRKEQQGKL
jgi:hypothetical protein